jgi:hypothetical protein
MDKMSLDTPQIKELIKKARDNNDVVLFKNQLPNVLKWENFIDILNYKYHSLNQQNSKQEPGNRLLENNNRITDILIYNNLDMHVFDILGYNKKWYDEFLKILNNSFNIDFPGSKVLINFIGNEAEYGIHSDDHDVLLWNCIGSVSWNIYSSDSDYKTYVINAGDVLFAPKGVIHQAVVTEPRASVVFGFDYEKSKTYYK